MGNRVAIYVPMTDDERRDYEAHLAINTLTAGRWVKSLIMRAIRGDGSGQARELADAVKAARL